MSSINIKKPPRPRYKRDTLTYFQDNILDIIDIGETLSKNRYIDKVPRTDFIYNKDLPQPNDNNNNNKKSPPTYHRRQSISALNKSIENDPNFTYSYENINFEKLNDNKFKINFKTLKLEYKTGYKVLFIQEYYPIEIMGAGAFGLVVKVIEVKTGQKMAVKIIDKQNPKHKQNLDYLLNEVHILNLLDNPRIMKLFSTLDNRHYFFIFMEIIEGGNLKDVIIKRYQDPNKKYLFRDSECSLIMKGLLEALNYLHKNRIIHRDIKPENILFKVEDDFNSLCLCDFGLSYQLNSYENLITGSCGTTIYMAPEVLLKRKYDALIDSFSAGVVLFILCSGGMHPFVKKGMSVQEYIKQVQEMKGIYYFSTNMPLLARNLFLKLCKFEPLFRYEPFKALSHPWITRSDESQIPMTLLEEYNKNDKIKTFKGLLSAMMVLPLFKKWYKIKRKNGNINNNNNENSGYINENNGSGNSNNNKEYYFEGEKFSGRKTSHSSSNFRHKNMGLNKINKINNYINKANNENNIIHEVKDLEEDDEKKSDNNSEKSGNESNNNSNSNSKESEEEKEKEKDNKRKESGIAEQQSSNNIINNLSNNTNSTNNINSSNNNNYCHLSAEGKKMPKIYLSGHYNSSHLVEEKKIIPKKINFASTPFSFKANTSGSNINLNYNNNFGNNNNNILNSNSVGSNKKTIPPLIPNNNKNILNNSNTNYNNINNSSNNINIHVSNNSNNLFIKTGNYFNRYQNLNQNYDVDLSGALRTKSSNDVGKKYFFDKYLSESQKNTKNINNNHNNNGGHINSKLIKSTGNIFLNNLLMNNNSKSSNNKLNNGGINQVPNNMIFNGFNNTSCHINKNMTMKSHISIESKSKSKDKKNFLINAIVTPNKVNNNKYKSANKINSNNLNNKDLASCTFNGNKNSARHSGNIKLGGVLMNKRHKNIRQKNLFLKDGKYNPNTNNNNVG